MTWKSIRLELARTEQYPDGSPRHVYIVHAPLTADGLIDEQKLKLAPERASVQRSWDSERPRSGYLVKTARGWTFSYEPGEEDDELIFQLHSDFLRQGEYVIIIRPDYSAVPLRVVWTEEFT